MKPSQIYISPEFEKAIEERGTKIDDVLKELAQPGANMIIIRKEKN